MCHLLRHGFIAALAPAGVPNCDIVVTDELGDRLCAVQVKSRRAIGTDGGWHMGRKHESLVSDTLFYAFVDFGKDPGSTPEVFVLPSQIVADAVRDTHAAWLAQPGAKGQPRNDSSFRRLLPNCECYGLASYGRGWLERYCNAWHLLTLD